MENILPVKAFDFLDILDQLNISYALIGGIAAGYWSNQRYTRDMDLTLFFKGEDWIQLKKQLESSSEIKINQIAEEKDLEFPYLIRIEYRSYPIDLIISLTEFQKSMISRRVEVELLGKKIKIATQEDVIISKLIAGRSQDLVDIESILKRFSNQIGRA